MSKRREFAHVFQRKSACDSYRPSRILSLEFIGIGLRKERLISVPKKIKFINDTIDVFKAWCV